MSQILKESGEWEQTIIVKVNGKEYPTQLYDGVQRFVPNAIVEHIVDQAYEAFVKKENTLDIDLNSIKIKVLNGELPIKDYIEYLTMFGYSVSGFCDAVYSTIELNSHIFPGETEDWFTIENPLWENN